MNDKITNAVILWDWRGTLNKLEETECIRLLSMCHNEGFVNVLHSSNKYDVPMEIYGVFSSCIEKTLRCDEKADGIRQLGTNDLIIVDDQAMNLTKDLLESCGLSAFAASQSKSLLNGLMRIEMKKLVARFSLDEFGDQIEIYYIFGGCYEVRSSLCEYDALHKNRFVVSLKTRRLLFFEWLL